MRKILIIGIGAGNPDYVTAQAVAALRQVDVFFMPDKGEEKAALQRLRTDVCARFIPDATYRLADYRIPPRREPRADYLGSVDDWHARLAASYERLFLEHLAEGACGAFLVWGDPALYDSTLRIIERVQAKGFALTVEIIPGISAVQVLAARHRIALNTIGDPVLITPGRKLGHVFPDGVGTVVVMLDGEQAFTRMAPDGIDIYWGAYLGTPDEILVAGKLAEAAEEIVAVRQQARARHGWIMDTYLLRRSQI